MNAQGTGASSSSADAPVGVDSVAAGRLQLLSIGATAPSGHALAWLTQDAGGNAAVHLRRYDAQGQPAGSDVVVGVDTLDGDPAAAVLADGSVAIASPVAGPLSVDQPWITRSAIRVQRFDTEGRSADDIDIGILLQNRIGATTMRYVADPAVIRWDHGGFLVGWALVEEDAGGRRPQFWVQRFNAAAQPVGAPSLAAQGEIDSGFRLTASPNGGWVLTTFHRVMGRAFIRHHPFEGASAPALAAGALGVAEGSLLVPLHGGGTLLVSPSRSSGTWQVYGAGGQVQPIAGALAAKPLAAAALRDGGFVVFGGDGQVQAHRYDAAGQAVGAAVPIAAGANLQAMAMADGSVLMGWTAGRAGGGTDLSTQRLR